MYKEIFSIKNIFPSISLKIFGLISIIFLHLSKNFRINIYNIYIYFIKQKIIYLLQL